MAFTPRTKAPDKTDPHWIHTSAGGMNSCIKIKGNSVLPNCVGYAWGRWYELTDKKPKLSRANAEVWFRKEDGYERGQEPRLGAVACWSRGKVGAAQDGAGHVAVVEEIRADGSIVTSNSAYGGRRWYKKSIRPPYDFGKFRFQGFIYLPQEFAPDSKGDVNGDGKVDAKDARLILRYTAGLVGEDGLDLEAADVDGDGRVNARDARLLLRLAAETEAGETAQ